MRLNPNIRGTRTHRAKSVTGIRTAHSTSLLETRGKPTFAICSYQKLLTIRELVEACRDNPFTLFLLEDPTT